MKSHNQLVLGTLSLCTFLLFLFPLSVAAGVTTYTFTSKTWASKVGATVCDGVTDGWKCDQAAYEYSAGRTAADGRLYSCGVGVKTSTTGADFSGRSACYH